MPINTYTSNYSAGLQTLLENLASTNPQSATLSASIVNMLNKDPAFLSDLNNAANGSGGFALLTEIKYTAIVGSSGFANMQPTVVFGANGLVTDVKMVMNIGFDRISSSGSINIAMLRDVVGHEVSGHARNAVSINSADHDVTYPALNAMANQPLGTPHNYTGIVQQYLNNHLQDEGIANIAGWNRAVTGYLADINQQRAANGLAALTSLDSAQLGAVAASTRNLHFFDTGGKGSQGSQGKPRVRSCK